jgi:DNA-binding IscR family transcriptional regulator
MKMKTMKFFFDCRFPKLTGTEKLMLLSLMMYANEQGYGIWPSVESLAVRANVRRSQAQKILKKLEHVEYLETVGNEKGGARHNTKWRRLNMLLIRKDAKPMRPVDVDQPNEDADVADVDLPSALDHVFSPRYRH